MDLQDGREWRWGKRDQLWWILLTSLPNSADGGLMNSCRYEKKLWWFPSTIVSMQIVVIFTDLWAHPCLVMRLKYLPFVSKLLLLKSLLLRTNRGLHKVLILNSTSKPRTTQIGTSLSFSLSSLISETCYWWASGRVSWPVLIKSLRCLLHSSMWSLE